MSTRARLRLFDAAVLLLVVLTVLIVAIAA